MKGLKSKLLIAFLIVISIVLGYQAFVMADDTLNCGGKTFTRTSSSVPFESDGYFILCREHTNSWKDVWKFTCKSELKINAEGKDENGAHGMAYFLSRGSTVGKNENNEIQRFIWSHCAQFNGGKILYAGSDYRSLFALNGISGDVDTIEEFYDEGYINKVNENINTEDAKPLSQALENKTVAIVDQVPYSFFTTSSGITEETEGDIRISDISYEEYNYLNQLYYIFNYIYANGGTNLKAHINNYVTSNDSSNNNYGLTIYKGDLPTNTTDFNVTPAVVKTEYTEDFYGQKIILTKLDLNQNGVKDADGNAYMWRYVVTGGDNIETVNVDGQNYTVDKTIYYADDTSGTTKFSDRIYLNKNKDTMLNNYKSLYYGDSYNFNRFIEDLKNYSETIEVKDEEGNVIDTTTVDFDKLAAILENECKGLTGEELYNEITQLRNGYYNKVHAVAEKSSEEVSVDAKFENSEGTNIYTFTGSTEQAAKVYQWLVDNDIFENCASSIKLNKDDARVAIDRQNGGNYIVGPFSLDYYTVKLNGEEVLGLTEFDILIDTKDKGTSIISATEESLIINEENLVTKEVQDENGETKTVTVPKSGANFYIQISQEEVTTLIGRTLTKDDSIGVRGTYRYLDYVEATIHFLQGGSGDNHDEGIFDSRHAQRLMTYETKDHWKYEPVEETVNPNDIVIELIKYDSENASLNLAGAKFYIVGQYRDSNGNIKYVDLDTLTKDYGNTLQSTIENDELNGKKLTVYETQEDGAIKLTNRISTTIRVGDVNYDLVGIAYKEIEAPWGYKVTDPNWKIYEMAFKGSDVISIPVPNEKLDYDLDILKVDNKDEGIENLTLNYKFFEVGNENRETDWMTATTGEGEEKGKVKFENIKLFNNVPDSNGNYSELVALQIEETGEVANKYNYFRAIQVVYKVTITKDNKVIIEFFDYNTADANTKALWENWEKVKDGEFNINVINGISRVVDSEGNELSTNESGNYDDYVIANNENINSSNIDITIINDDLNEKYSLTINKVTVENGQLVTSQYLKDTKFYVHIGRGEEEYLLEDEITIGEDGKGTLTNIEVYSENAEDYLYLYLTEEPNSGFKTGLTEEDSSPILTYTATKTGEISIIDIEENKLDPIQKITDGDEVKVDNAININLTAVNEPEEYKLRFRKVSKSGIPLSDVTFKLEGEGYSVEASSDENGYMTFEGLTHTGEVTLSLYETKPKDKYYSENDSNNPLTITYTYHAGSGKLENLTIKDENRNITYLDKAELSKSDTDNGILFDFGTLNEIFTLVNNPNPYDVQFIKIGDDDILLNGKVFKVSIYTLDDKENKVYATNANGQIKEVEVTSENGIVIIEDVNEYGEFYVEIEEIPNENSDYETLEDILRVSYNIIEGKSEVVWGNKLEILDENGTVVDDYDRKSDSKKFGAYDYVKIEEDELYVINDKLSYDLNIHKTDTMDVGLENIEFSAVIYKEGTSESISIPKDDSYNLVTNENGIVALSDINIYSTEEYPTITLALTEKNIPEGYRWHEYGSITYIYEYEKYSATDSIEFISGKIIAKENPESSETIVLESNIPNPFDGATLNVTNYPETTLDVFDGKAVIEKESVESEENYLEKVDLSQRLIESGITFTAEIKAPNGDPINNKKENIEVTLNENGIVAHNIELYPQFIQNGEYKVERLQLVIKETEIPGLIKIDPITIVFNCEYDATSNKLITEKVAYIYQGETYEIGDIEDASDKNVAVIDGVVYVDTEGRHILVNQSEPVTELKIKKVDDSGNSINGITFVGKIVNEKDEEVTFETTTDTIDGIDGIGKIEIGFEDKEKVLGHTVNVVITDEYWAADAEHENSELEFIEGDITISGIEIDENGNVTFPETVKVELENDEYINQVEIDKATMAIKVTNNKETYDIPIIKTNSDLSQNEKADRLKDVVFNFTVKEATAEDSQAKTFSNVKTDEKGEICLNDIDIFGENLVLTIEEIQAYPGTLILDEIVEVPYSAELEDGEVVVTFKDDAIKQISKTTEENVVPIENENEQFIGINVINTMDYSIVLHKKMNINGTMTEIDSDNEKVIFKGIITTNSELSINNKNVGELTKDELESFIDEIGTTEDFITEKEEYEDTKFFRLTTDSENMAEIDKLTFYNKSVNVYFVEELVNENSSMTEIEDVMKVSFYSNKEDITNTVVAPSDKVSINDDNRLKIEVTVINDAIAYKARIRKVDSTDGEVMNLAGAEFKFTLSELATNNGTLATIDSDTVTITFDATGKVSDDVEYGKYIVGAVVDEDGYIVLDINKYGENLQLQIEELKAPTNYIKINEILSVSYTATAGQISNVSSAKLEAKVMEGTVLGLDIELQNTPEPYDLPIYKKVTDGSTTEQAGSEEAIKFDIKFFKKNEENQEYERIMEDKNVSYPVEAGKVTVKDIETFGTYYMAIEETDSSDSVVRIEGIQVFKITASPEEKISEIVFIGTGTIDGNGKLVIDENNKEYEEYFDCEDETQAGLARLEITNIKTKDYSIDFTKIDENGNPLNGAEFEVYLTEQDESYLTAINKLDKKEYTTETIGTNEDAKDGKIIIPNLRFIGEYKLTIIETKPPVGMEKAFDKVEILYSTTDGYNITVTDVYIDGVRTESKNIVKYNKENQASIAIQLVNYTLQPVPINIHKVYYDEVNGQMLELPIENVMFAGTVTDKYGNTHDFANVTTNEQGNANIGDFRVDGEVKVTIREISAPAGFDKIPKTNIKLQVNNEQKTIESYTIGQNTLAEITDDNVLVVVDREVINPTISLGGIVWEDYRNSLKEDASYTEEGYYTEGLYDKNIDTLVNGIKVKLYDSEGTFIKETTTESGAYSFDDLDPFKEYYMTFEYDGENYESVKYLVKGVENGKVVSYGKISDAIKDEVSWENNSKAITNEDDQSIATTVKNDEASGIQYYPAYDQFVIDYIDEDETNFIVYFDNETGEYTIEKPEDSDDVKKLEFKPLNPTHQRINLGLKLKNTFDLSLSKDVYSMIVKLKNCTENEYLYKLGEDHKMYTLKLTPEDINILERMSIIYTIEIRNEDLATGTLESIVEYYNKDLLDIDSAWIEGAEGNTEAITIPNKNDEEDEEDAANVIIPEQTYSYDNDEYSKDNEAATGRVEIPIDRELKANGTITIKVKYNYDINELKKGLAAGGSVDVGNQYITLGIAEIMGSEANNGRQDKDSTADSLDSREYAKLSDLYIDDGDTSYYIDIKDDIREDDASTAPAAKIIVDQNTRTISGNVFDDINANGILDEETFVNGVTVKLVNDYTKDEIKQTIDNTEGYYCFTNIAAGTYHVEFTYGDKNTVLPVLTIRNAQGEVEKVEEDEVNIGTTPYPRKNQKSYNAFEFESTNYKNKTISSYWFENETERLSDARDKADSRDSADYALNGEGKKESQEATEIYYQMNNKKAEQLYSYMGDSSVGTVQTDIETLAENAVTATTDSFVIDPEKTTTHRLQYEEYESGAIYLADIQPSGEVSSNQVTPNSTGATNIDFGIKARPQSDITVEKEVENVKIYTAAGIVTVDVAKNDDGEVIGERAKVLWSDASTNKAGQIWIQRDDEEITGAKLEITYKITVKNNAEDNSEEYGYDTKEMIVTVADYIQDELTYSPTKNEGRGWNEVKVSSIIKEEDKIESSAVGNVEINNHIDLTSVKKVVTQDVHLDSENEYKEELLITLTKTLNSYSNTDADSYTNYVEVIQTAAQKTAKKDSNSIPGNYDPVTKTVTEGNLGRIVTGLDSFGLEKDTAQAQETVITAETGENRQTYYILAISVITVFAVGVILIKKKVLDK